jgi:hypothetical protein
MSASSGPIASQRLPNAIDEPKRDSATAVCAAAIPVPRALAGTSRLTSAASTPSVAA